jgi:hypothetical protein
MSHLILKLFGSPSPWIAAARPLFGTGVNASRYLDDNPPHGVSSLAGATKPRWKRRLWIGGSPEVDIAPANLTPIDELMLNLP